MAPASLSGVITQQQALQREIGVCPLCAGDALDSHTARWQLPPSFLCPISQQCMHDPVVLSDGHTYERLHIELWLQEHITSPVSGLQLQQREFLPNHALRNAIEEYFEQVMREHRQKIWSILSELEEEGKDGELAIAESLVGIIDSLIEWSVLMNPHWDTERVLLRLIDEAKTLLTVEAISFLLLNSQRQALVPMVSRADGDTWAPVTIGIEGVVAKTGKPLIIQDALLDKRIDLTVLAKTGIKPRSVLCVPVKGSTGEVLAIARAINKVTRAREPGRGRGPSDVTDSEAFTAHDRDFLQVFATQALSALATASKNAAAPQRPLAEPRSDEFCAGSPLVKSPEKVRRDDADAEALLERAFAGWQFDAFELAEVTANRPLSVLAEYLFNRLGYVQEFNLDREKMAFFFAEIESGYDDANPYHNRAHAASVLHAMHALLEHGKVMEAVAPAFEKALGDKPRAEGAGIGSLERMACLLAAAIHDYDHVGLNNDFLVKTSHERAVRYNDQHANEHHHVASAFAVLLRPECNFLAQLPASDFRRVRGLAIDLVLSTDMADNNSIVKSFTEVLDAREKQRATADHEGVAATAAFEPETVAEASLLLQVAMKCADLGHLALDWDLHVRWVSLLEEEFFKQGDKEKHTGLSVSFLMDRQKPGASATQVGFFNFVVLPLFKVLHRAVPAVQPMLDTLMANYESWKQHEEQKAAKCNDETTAPMEVDSDRE